MVAAEKGDGADERNEEGVDAIWTESEENDLKN